jgi:small subunit ribosomal protein S1
MSDDLFEKDINHNESFAELFESYMTEKDDVQLGDKIKGEIIAIGDKDIFINTGTKTDGVVEKNELLNDDGELTFQTGDLLELYVVSINEGEIRLSKSISGGGSDRLLYDAYKNHIPVEGKVIEQCKGGFRVSVMNKKAFCPISQIDIKYVEAPEAYVGETFDFYLTKIEEHGKNIIISRRELLNQQHEEAKKDFFKEAKTGDIIEGTIKTIMPYGVFVEIYPGIEGLVHISELSWSRISHPEEIIKLNDPIKVKILDINNESSKISLSSKQVSGDPWETVNQHFKSGDKINGKVTRCADFGAFVEISPGIEGLVHISEMSYIKRVLKADDMVSPGDIIPVVIKEIDSINRRISLSMKEAEGDPWINIDKKYAIGQKITGRIEKKESFGYLIAVEDGIIGLLPKSKINTAVNPAEIEKLKTDDAITVKIEEVKPKERKITLGLEDAESDWKNFQTSKISSGASGSLGELGEKLRSALNSKK